MLFVIARCSFADRIEVGFVPGMTVPGTFYLNDSLYDLVIDELQQILAEHLDATKAKFMYPYSNTNPKYDNHDDNDEDV